MEGTATTCMTLTRAMAVILGCNVLTAFDAVVAEKFQKLTGSQIRAKFAGMEVTDEVHWRDIYERDGTLRREGFFIRASRYTESRNNGTPLQVNDTVLRQIAAGFAEFQVGKRCGGGGVAHWPLSIPKLIFTHSWSCWMIP